MADQKVAIIRPVQRPVRGSVTVPGSKSMTNRALAMAAFATGESVLHNAVFCDDSIAMTRCLLELGIRVTWDHKANLVKVVGCGGMTPMEEATLNTMGSGTTMRFLTTLIATSKGRFRMDGDDRMRQRPIHDLVQAMQQLGIIIFFARTPGFPPLTIHAREWPRGHIKVPGRVSSQFASALLLAGPLTTGLYDVELDDDTVSRPYIEMTLSMMQEFGASFQRKGNLVRFDFGAGYVGTEIDIEPDASTASYFFAAAAMTKGEVTIAGLSQRSLQGDIACLDFLRQMGCAVLWHDMGVTLKGNSLRGGTFNLRDCSDLLPALAVVASVSEGETNFTGVDHVVHKESDRIFGLGRQLLIHDIPVTMQEDRLTIRQAQHYAATESFDPLNDHRLAMSFALLGLVHDTTQVANPDCVSKTFPNYWQELDRLIRPAGGSVELANDSSDFLIDFED